MKFLIGNLNFAELAYTLLWYFSLLFIVILTFVWKTHHKSEIWCCWKFKQRCSYSLTLIFNGHKTFQLFNRLIAFKGNNIATKMRSSRPCPQNNEDPLFPLFSYSEKLRWGQGWGRMKKFYCHHCSHWTDSAYYSNAFISNFEHNIVCWNIIT